MVDPIAVDALASDKEIGPPKDIIGVQVIRRIISIGLVIDEDSGQYSEVISYQEMSVDSGSKLVGSIISMNKSLSDIELGVDGKAEIDAIYARALAVL